MSLKVKENCKIITKQIHQCERLGLYDFYKYYLQNKFNKKMVMDFQVWKKKSPFHC